MKNFLKKALALAICVLMINPGLTYALSSDFDDIQGHWAENHIRQLMRKRLIWGCGDGTYKPNHDISREELKNMLERAFISIEEAGIATSDMRNAMDFLYLSPDGTESYDPQSTICRQDMAFFLNELLSMDIYSLADYLNNFQDSDQIDSNLKPLINSITANELMIGGPRGFSPRTPLTRGEAAVIVERLITRLTNLTVYDKPGYFALGKKIGTTLVRTGGFNLRDSQLIGDLIIEDQGDGQEITLSNVTITGSLKIIGPAKITLSGGKIGSILVDGISGARILATQNPLIGRVRLRTGAHLEEVPGTLDGFNEILTEPNMYLDEEVILFGDFNRVTISSNLTRLRLLNGSISVLNVLQGSRNTSLDLAFGTELKNLIAGSGIHITGRGALLRAVINALNVRTEQMPQIYEIAPGLCAVLGYGVLAPSSSSNTGGSQPPSLSNNASLSDLKVNGQTITRFSAEVTDYVVKVAEGTTEVPVVTATASDVNASVEIVPAAGIPGETHVIVTAQNGSKKTYRIGFVVRTAEDDVVSQVLNSLTLSVQDAKGHNKTPKISLPSTDSLGHETLLEWEIENSSFAAIDNGMVIINRRAGGGHDDGGSGGHDDSDEGGCGDHEDGDEGGSGGHDDGDEGGCSSTHSLLSEPSIVMLSGGCGGDDSGDDHGGSGGDDGGDDHGGCGGSSGGKINTVALFVSVSKGDAKADKTFYINIPWGWGKSVTISTTPPANSDHDHDHDVTLPPEARIHPAKVLYLGQFHLSLSPEFLASYGKSIIEAELSSEPPEEEMLDLELLQDAVLAPELTGDETIEAESLIVEEDKNSSTEEPENGSGETNLYDSQNHDASDVDSSMDNTGQPESISQGENSNMDSADESHVTDEPFTPVNSEETIVNTDSTGEGEENVESSEESVTDEGIDEGILEETPSIEDSTDESPEGDNNLAGETSVDEEGAEETAEDVTDIVSDGSEEATEESSDNASEDTSGELDQGAFEESPQEAVKDPTEKTMQLVETSADEAVPDEAPVEIPPVAELTITAEGRLRIVPLRSGRGIIHAKVGNSMGQVDVTYELIVEEPAQVTDAEAVEQVASSLKLSLSKKGHGKKQENKVVIPNTDYFGYGTTINWETTNENFVTISDIGFKAIINRRGKTEGGGGCSHDSHDIEALMSMTDVSIQCGDSGDTHDDGGCGDDSHESGGSMGGKLNVAYLKATISRGTAQPIVKSFKIIIPWGWGRPILIEEE